MHISTHDIARLEEGIGALPAGSELCNRIRSAVVPDSKAVFPDEEKWQQIGEAFIFCTGFPAGAFRELAAGTDFDVRWALTFACWYWGASGASVDRECRNFLHGAGHAELARDCLPEYVGQWVDEWRTRFEQHFDSDG